MKLLLSELFTFSELESKKKKEKITKLTMDTLMVMGSVLLAETKQELEIRKGIAGILIIKNNFSKRFPDNLEYFKEKYPAFSKYFKDPKNKLMWYFAAVDNLQHLK